MLLSVRSCHDQMTWQSIFIHILSVFDENAVCPIFRALSSRRTFVIALTSAAT